MSTLSGVYRATVVDNADPSGRMRILVSAPAILGEWAVWAEACVPYGSRALPTMSSTVWLQFEGGDASRPVWMGVLPGD